MGYQEISYARNRSQCLVAVLDVGLDVALLCPTKYDMKEWNATEFFKGIKSRD